MTPDKKYAPSTADNYNVDDLSSGDETDNEEQPRKIPPKWAQSKKKLFKKFVLEFAVARHESILKQRLNEIQRERFFGKIKQPTLSDLYYNNKKNYPMRNSSAIWTSPMSDPTLGESRFKMFNIKK